MKKLTLLVAFAAALLTLPAMAQEVKRTTRNDATGAKTETEVKVRDNGTMKVETESRTGRTKAGEVVHEAGQDTKMAGKKVAHGTKKAGKAVSRTAKKGANKVEDAVD